MSDKEEPELKISPAADEAMAKLVELFSTQAFPQKYNSVAPLKGRTNSIFYSSRSLMTNSAMIQMATTSNGSDVYIASVLFREFPAIGKWQIEIAP